MHLRVHRVTDREPFIVFGMAGHLERLLENRVPEAWLFNQS